MSRVIVFELNEVPWRVIDDYAAARPQSALARILARSQQFRTVADDEELSPWVTWASVHRGVGDGAHTISDFGQDLSHVNADFPPIWELLARAGVRTGVCGSLHSYPLPDSLSDMAFYIPDAFAAGAECFPKEVEAFQEFNLAMSRQSGRNVSAGTPLGKAVQFLSRAPSLGISPKTAMEIGLHLIDERARQWPKVRRRTWQVALAFDIFLEQLRSTRPSFATFFTNHVASTMHRYWAARYPGDYDEFGYGDAWVSTYSQEIDFTMGRFDAMLNRLLRFIEEDGHYQLWVASSMGQAATKAQPVGTQAYLKHVESFLRALDFDPTGVESMPAMLPRVILNVGVDRVGDFVEKLRTVQVSDRGALPFETLAEGIVRIHPGVLQDLTDLTVRIGDKTLPFEAAGFENIKIQDGTGQSAYHIREGSLIVHHPRRPTAPPAERTEISTLELAPSLLRHFGVERPSYMPEPAAALAS